MASGGSSACVLRVPLSRPTLLRCRSLPARVQIVGCLVAFAIFGAVMTWKVFVRPN